MVGRRRAGARPLGRVATARRRAAHILAGRAGASAMEELPTVVDHVRAGLRWWERTNPVVAEQYAREVVRLLAPVAADLDRRQIRGTK